MVVRYPSEGLETEGGASGMTADEAASSPRRRSSATIIDVARAAGVSRATAARALGGYGSVSDASATAVREAAEAVGYQANAVARSMITGRTRTLGVILSDIENDFFVRALRGISHIARDKGFDVLLANTDEDVELERRTLEMMRSRRVEGLILCAADLDQIDHLHAVADGGQPLVLLDREAAQVPADSVGIDNRGAGYRATRILLEAGHTCIAVVSGLKPELIDRARSSAGARPQPGESPSEGRVAGYFQALLEAGVEPDPRLQVAVSLDVAAVSEGVGEVLASEHPPTAIVASDSLQTLGALHAVRRAGLSIPDDISLLGFDDSDWAPVVEPPLSVIEQPAYDIGLRAAELLVARIEGDAGELERVQLPVAYVERESIGPPR